MYSAEEILKSMPKPDRTRIAAGHKEVPVNQLSGAALDLMATRVAIRADICIDDPLAFSPSTKWEHLGPLLEKVRPYISPNGLNQWRVQVIGHSNVYYSQSMMLAACRAIVEAAFGSSVQVPMAVLQEAKR
jgi:hypothetical protein